MKDTEKDLKDELRKVFAGQSQCFTMISKFILSIIKHGSISYSKLS